MSDGCPIDPVLAANRLIGYNDVTVHGVTTTMADRMDQRWDILMDHDSVAVADSVWHDGTAAESTAAENPTVEPDDASMGMVRVRYYGLFHCQYDPNQLSQPGHCDPNVYCMLAYRSIIRCHCDSSIAPAENDERKEFR